MKKDIARIEALALLGLSMLACNISTSISRVNLNLYSDNDIASASINDGSYALMVSIRRGEKDIILQNGKRSGLNGVSALSWGRPFFDIKLP